MYALIGIKERNAKFNSTEGKPPRIQSGCVLLAGKKCSSEKALHNFRVTVPEKVLADAGFYLAITSVGTNKDCHSRLNILIFLSHSLVIYTFCGK